jgi:hypothetical protein
MTGQEIDYNKHVRLEFGKYVQTHEEHDNAMTDRTLGAICLSPTGSEHGTHWFMCVSSGARITRTRWTPLPMPKEVIQRVSEISQLQGAPMTCTFGDRHAREIEDNLTDLDDYSDDGSYQPSESSNDDDDAISSNDDDYASNESDEVDDNDSDNDDDSADIDADAPESEESYSSDSVTSDNDESIENTGVESNDVGSDDDDESVDNTGMENNDAGSDDDEESIENTGVGDDDESVENTGVHQPMEYKRFTQAEEAGRTAALNNDNKPRARSTVALEFMFEDMDPNSIFELMSGEDEEDMLSFVTVQMTAKAGLKYFGQDGADAIMVELEQLLYCKVMDGCKAGDQSKEQKKAALKYLMFLKQKRCGKIKGRGCADGRKQRLYKTKEESSSPTISIEALFLTCMIDAMEDRYMVTCDIPGAFMHADIDELIHIKLEGELVDLLIRLDATYNS